MKKAYLPGLLFIIPFTVLAQSGKITGKVISASSGQGLSAATLVLIEKSKTEIADQNGNFTFNRLAAGVYSIKSSYAGLDEKSIGEITVKDGDNVTITINKEATDSTLALLLDCTTIPVLLFSSREIVIVTFSPSFTVISPILFSSSPA